MCYLNADMGDRANQVLHFLPKIATADDLVVMNIVSILTSPLDSDFLPRWPQRLHPHHSVTC